MKAIKLQLQQVIKGAKAAPRRASSRSVAKDVLHSEESESKLQQQPQVTEKDLNQIMHSSHSYSESMAARQARDKLLYIEKKHKEILAREQAVKDKEEQCKISRGP